MSHRDFHVQLENFRNEANNATMYIYSDMAVNHAASQSRAVLKRLNDTPTFWNVHAAALQTAAYMAIGRIFDTTSRFNIDKLLCSFEVNLALFSREELKRRKMQDRQEEPEWLVDYLAKAHYPSRQDVAYLRRRVNDYRQIYERAIKPVRHKYLAHREKQEHMEVQALYARGKVRELWRMAKFLQGLHVALREQFENGRKPIVRIGRFSVKSLYDAPDEHGDGTHQHIISETRRLMSFLETAHSNQLLKPTV